MTELPRLIVGVGASAGGLEALTQFFEFAPQSSGIAYVVVQHLSPDFKSMMPELLSRHTRMSIEVVTDGTRLEPNRVYVNSPLTDLTVVDDRLTVTSWDDATTMHRPIDALFRSLAERCPHRAVVVVLSGSGTDGAQGVEAMHDADGLTLVQDPNTAQFDGMPTAAVATGAANFVVAPAQMAELLLQHLETPFTTSEVSEGSEPQDLYDQFYHLLKKRIRVDFSQYKPTTAGRRVRRRADRLGVTLDRYLDTVRVDEDELDRLYWDMLIGVTEFFRDPDAYEILARQVLPHLAARATEEAPIRVWVAGCATGEEAYSVAILLAEATRSPTTFQVFATDVHPGSLRAASNGVFEHADQRVPPELLERYFEQVQGGWQVRAFLRRTIVFAPHDLLADAPFSRVDLACCRNVLIYLKAESQHRAIARLHFSLRLGGTLFLGPSESLGPFEDQYDVVDRRWKVFRKIGNRRLPLEGPNLRLQAVPRPARIREMAQPPHLLAAYDRILDQFAPPGLLLDGNRNLVHTFGAADRYLRVPSGRVTQDVLQLVDPELKPALGAALHRMDTASASTVFSSTFAGQSLEISVSRLDLGEHRPEYLLVTLGAAPTPPLRPASMTAVEQSAAEASRVADLERELAWTRETLQSTMEAADVVNEELQATNEELVAANEELQSTNEELQSVNEELHTVNAEYQETNVELRHTTADLDLLLRSTRIGVVFLDAELRVRRFTPEATRLFPILQQDVGRPIADLKSTVPDLPYVEDARAILAGEQGAIEHRVELADGLVLLCRTLPYLDEQHQVRGVVLAFVDISSLAEVEREVEFGRTELQTVLDAVPTGVLLYGADRRIRYASRTGASVEGAKPEDLVGRYLEELTGPDEGREQRIARVLGGESFAIRAVERNDAFYDLSYKPIVDGDRIAGFVEAFSDVTDHVLLSRSLEADARLIGHLPVGLIIVRAPKPRALTDLVVVSVNEAMSSLCGFDARASIGGTLLSLLPALTGSPLTERFLAPMTTRERSVFEMEYADERILRAWWRVNGSRLDADHLLLMVEDVTEERKLREQQMSSLRLEAIAAVAGGVAHDLNNMLGAILLTGRTLRAELDDEKSHVADLEAILGTTHRAADLVARLMDFTRQRVVAPKVISLSDTVAAAAPVVRGLLGATIDVVLDLEPRATALLDPNVVDQVLVNLATNAKFAMPDGGLLVIGVRRVKDPVVRQRGLTGAYVEWTVRDSGEGMDAATLDRCFEPFFTTRPRGVGTGMGLAMVHGVVSQARGAVEAISSPGHGTTIRMVFPEVVGTASQDLEPVVSEPRVALPAGLKVLLVDDEELLRRATARGLVRRGMEVVEASSGDAALDMIRGGLRPDVLVTDVLMPGMSGPALIEELARGGFTFPAILMSGYTHAALRTHLWEGAIYVPKPFSYEQLESAIHRALAGRAPPDGAPPPG